MILTPKARQLTILSDISPDQNDGSEVVVLRDAFSYPNLPVRPESRGAFADAAEAQRSRRGCGAHHRRRQRNRTTLGPRIRQARSQKGTKVFPNEPF